VTLRSEGTFVFIGRFNDKEERFTRDFIQLGPCELHVDEHGNLRLASR
jgi:hypothetical protein